MHSISPWGGLSTCGGLTTRLCAIAVLALLPCTAQQPAAPAAAPATYVGSETCGMCHEDIGKAIAKSPHQAVNINDKHGFKGQACEGCHGPGSNHAQSLSAADIR